jgi:hypothetical protein
MHKLFPKFNFAQGQILYGTPNIKANIRCKQIDELANVRVASQIHRGVEQL